NNINQLGCGEAGADCQMTNNSITASPQPGNGVLEVGTIFGALIQGNTLTATGTPNNWQFGISDCNGGLSPHTQILDNVLTVQGINAMAIATDGTVITGNTINEDSANDGIYYWTSQAVVSNNTWNLY